MNRISSVAIAFMLTFTTMSTGSLENPDFTRVNNSSNGFDGHENDTIDRTNTFPFDVLFDDTMIHLQKFTLIYLHFKQIILT